MTAWSNIFVYNRHQLSSDETICRGLFMPSSLTRYIPNVEQAELLIIEEGTQINHHPERLFCIGHMYSCRKEMTSLWSNYAQHMFISPFWPFVHIDDVNIKWHDSLRNQIESIHFYEIFRLEANELPARFNVFYSMFTVWPLFNVASFYIVHSYSSEDALNGTFPRWF